jgi:hypothetical protein
VKADEIRAALDKLRERIETAEAKGTAAALKYGSPDTVAGRSALAHFMVGWLGAALTDAGKTLATLAEQIQPRRPRKAPARARRNSR